MVVSKDMNKSYQKGEAVANNKEAEICRLQDAC
uniref:Uncharacterized protein n=1 Tax=uncultured prokaryote TaxID=198431 RepID=A0A0H5Q335_9ZZZZ|nr:hypothetical protein [uncultured prokaryote]